MSTERAVRSTGATSKGAFAVPTQRWFANDLRALVEEVVFSPEAQARGIFDPVELRSGVHGFDGLWSALSVELWHRIHIDQDRRWLERVEPAVLSGSVSANATTEYIGIG